MIDTTVLIQALALGIPAILTAVQWDQKQAKKVAA